MLVQIASAILAGAALVDGLSSLRFLKIGLSEQNPIFGSHPGKTRLFGEGAAIIAIEIFLAMLLAHWSHKIGIAAAVGLIVQSVFHIRYAITNFKNY